MTLSSDIEFWSSSINFFIALEDHKNTEEVVVFGHIISNF